MDQPGKEGVGCLGRVGLSPEVPGWGMCREIYLLGGGCRVPRVNGGEHLGSETWSQKCILRVCTLRVWLRFDFTFCPQPLSPKPTLDVTDGALASWVGFPYVLLTTPVNSFSGLVYKVQNPESDSPALCLPAGPLHGLVVFICTTVFSGPLFSCFSLPLPGLHRLLPTWRPFS